MPAKPPCQIHPRAIVSDKVIIAGTKNVSIGADTVLHPYARLDSSQSSLHIGQSCVIAERTTIGPIDSGDETSGDDTGVTISDFVSIEAGAVVQGSLVGKGTVIEVNAVVGRNAVVGEVTTICHVKRNARVV